MISQCSQILVPGLQEIQLLVIAEIYLVLHRRERPKLKSVGLILSHRLPFGAKNIQAWYSREIKKNLMSLGPQLEGRLLLFYQWDHGQLIRYVTVSDFWLHRQTNPNSKITIWLPRRLFMLVYYFTDSNMFDMKFTRIFSFCSGVSSEDTCLGESEPMSMVSKQWHMLGLLAATQLKNPCLSTIKAYRPKPHRQSHRCLNQIELWKASVTWSRLNFTKEPGLSCLDILGIRI